MVERTNTTRPDQSADQGHSSGQDVSSVDSDYSTLGHRPDLRQYTQPVTLLLQVHDVVWGPAIIHRTISPAQLESASQFDTRTTEHPSRGDMEIIQKFLLDKVLKNFSLILNKENSSVWEIDIYCAEPEVHGEKRSHAWMQTFAPDSTRRPFGTGFFRKTFDNGQVYVSSLLPVHDHKLTRSFSAPQSRLVPSKPERLLSMGWRGLDPKEPD
ncbi:uncharacterized protein B0I36DRAFT_353263 [Microdochium trichocladiopsis]|uniref:Uncharacterized protein n=1 Tax=Microdochium trichocladiopsis TaxID=1682393 RepID=A0A9P8XYY3_9PEZI|nr:uncharacterized protein B0I36DRAFT_353263 [Microdochium trichocladiopsis]KAH7025099.1 hypothetical protein B0I36DRAFT_353263 [Microdochium trichocladiopsis]